MSIKSIRLPDGTMLSVRDWVSERRSFKGSTRQFVSLRLDELGFEAVVILGVITAGGDPGAPFSFLIQDRFFIQSTVGAWGFDAQVQRYLTLLRDLCALVAAELDVETRQPGTGALARAISKRVDSELYMDETGVAPQDVTLPNPLLLYEDECFEIRAPEDCTTTVIFLGARPVV